MRTSFRSFDIEPIKGDKDSLDLHSIKKNLSLDSRIDAIEERILAVEQKSHLLLISDNK